MYTFIPIMLALFAIITIFHLAPVSTSGPGPYVVGPGIDLVALNWRRFEKNHNHQDSENGELELRRSELIESKVAAIPDRILNNLPDDLNKQILETLASDQSLIMGPTMIDPTSTSDDSSEDPDGASIERLTKSCLTVHASSAKPEQLNVTFHLYTKNNPFSPYIMRPQISRLELIKSSPFNPTRPIKWITHGFHTNVDKSEWMLETKDKILAFEDANVILTDWRRGASPALAFYPKAAANAHVVAKLIVKILRRLRNDVDFSNVHLIGHSLGAHIMGFVGSAFTEEYLHQQQQLLMLRASASSTESQQNIWRSPQSSAFQSEALTSHAQLIGRITACDPALPCFGPTSSTPASNQLHQQQQQQVARSTQITTTTQSSLMSDDRNPMMALPPPYDAGPSGPLNDWTPTMWTHLRPDSAVVVEVMHSNPGVMGYSEPLGDFDFYPNGFDRQPGCGTQQQQQSSSHPHEVSKASGHQQNRFWRLPTQLQPEAQAHTSTMIRTRRQFMSNLMSSLMGRGSAMSPSSLASSNLSSLEKQQQMARQQGTGGTGISHTFDRFIKPIRDFFHGYTCSHHRSVEYMVESMYYDKIPQDRKLDKDFVCQMVGYRCSNYANFKKGFCFKCLSDHDCRAFTMTAPISPPPQFQIINPTTSTMNEAGFFSTPPTISTSTASILQARLHLPLISNARSIQQNSSFILNIPYGMEKFKIKLPFNESTQEEDSTSSSSSNAIKTEQSKLNKNNINNNNSSHLLKNVNKVAKRVLPTFNHYNNDYLPQKRSQYYFDTRSFKDFCLHHYHFYIKYRWFRVRESVTLDGFKLIGTIANITALSPSSSPSPSSSRTINSTFLLPNQQSAIVLNRFTYQSYTMLLTEPIFLGQIEALLILGDRIKSSLVEYIEISYMSNLDPKIRALGSARLCRSMASGQSIASSLLMQQEALHVNTNKLELNLFVRCSGIMV